MYKVKLTRTQLINTIELLSIIINVNSSLINKDKVNKLYKIYKKVLNDK
jgi:hypothetical protein